jgi:tRNA-Thr(GGU) m(6)t(6)A37 methyltransferase TsaA
MGGSLTLEPIGFVVGGRDEVIDDDWGGVAAVIRLSPDFSPDAVLGLDDFSHLEVVYSFHRAEAGDLERGARHPRGNTDWPRVGIFAQRGKDRPNHIGLARCTLDRLDGLDLHVRGLDALDGTPVLDVKPWMEEFAPQGPTRQPAWSRELMAGYW